MAVFGRKRRSAADADTDDFGEFGEFDEFGDDATAVEEGVRDDATGAAADTELGTNGPYDVDQVPGPQGRLDLGSLWLTAAPGMQLRLDMDPQTGEVTSVTAMLGQSALQLQAFAAPRSEGIWGEIREEISASVTGQGGTAEETPGPHGVELLTRIPARGPDGRTTHQQARFVGVDGPRWFLRGVVTGPAAIDEAQLMPLRFVFASSVVLRGAEARAPRELLPLHLPPEMREPQPGGDGAGDVEVADLDEPGAPDQANPALQDFRPFERGPEITEIR